MTLMFKAQGMYKYGCGLLETTAQAYVLPRSLARALYWSRSVNHRGKPDSNFPLDLEVEHENRLFKAEVRPHRGTVVVADG